MNMKKLKIWNAGLMLFGAVAFLLALITPAYAQVVEITVFLDGSQEVPPAATTGTGVANLTVDTATRQISGSVDFTGLTTPTTSGHIHIGAAGVNGPIIVPLIGGVGVTEGSMSVPPGSILLPNQLTALRNDGLYVNVHTSANPGGEIRGQILFTSARSGGSVDEVALVQVVSGNFNPMQTGDELAGLSAEGSIFVTLDMTTWMEIPGDFVKIFKGDFNEDGIDDLGGISAEDDSIRITTDFGLTWMTVPMPQK